MPSASKAKGNTFERDACKVLSELFDSNFMRVPTSGAFTGGANIFRVDSMTDTQRRIMSGDIIPGDTLDRWKFECKSYKAISWHQILQGECKLLDKWLEQAYDDKLPWLLFFKISRQNTWVSYPQDLPVVSSINRLTYSSPTGIVYIEQMQPFLVANVKNLKQINNAHRNID